MKREFLSNLGLEKEVIDKILDEVGNDIGKFKTEVESLKSERDKLKADISERDKQLETLQKNNKDNESLQKEIETLKAQNKEATENWEKEKKTLKVENALEIALTNAKARNKTAVKALLKDLDKAEFNDDGTIKGLADQIKALKEAEDSKFMFSESDNKLTGVNPANGRDQTGAIDTSKMTYSEMMKYQQENPGVKLF